ncbi:MAG: hypothetical protein FWH18_00795 [Marinilabiliaceae bacterium]|nr:hypothetical protein [Marinilabiliaceae bacterium]
MNVVVIHNSVWALAINFISIEVIKDYKDNCKEFKWHLIPEAVIENKDEHGIYFLKTSLKKPKNIKMKHLSGLFTTVSVT